MDVFEPGFQRRDGTLNLFGRDAQGAKFLQRLEGEKVGKAELLVRLNQTLFLPGFELALADVGDAANIFASPSP